MLKDAFLAETPTFLRKRVFFTLLMIGKITVHDHRKAFPNKRPCFEKGDSKFAHTYRKNSVGLPTVDSPNDNYDTFF